MATDVKLPDMGEGIDDVTINRWLVSVGDTINEGDNLVEVATDKVDTEVPSPASGTILKLNFGAGELASVNAVIAVIGEAGESTDDNGSDSGEAEASAETAEVKAERPAAEEPVADADESDDESKDGDQSSDGDVKATPVARRIAAEEGVTLSAVSGSGPGGQIRKNDVLSHVGQKKEAGAAPAKSLPAEFADVVPLNVRRVAADYDVDMRRVAKDRPLSSLTRYDVMRYVAERDNLDYLPTEPAYPSAAEVAPAPQPAKAEAPKADAAAQPKASSEKAPAKPAEAAAKSDLRAGEELVPHTRMRSLIARNTSQSAFTAPHVTTWWDVNMSAVLEHRKAHKNEFTKAGVNLTITAYFIEAMIAGVRAVPAANASWRDDGVIIRRTINVGMAAALPADEYGLGGLIVPVIKNADDLNLMGIARKVNELAQKARSNSLTAEELQGGTITLTNYGTSGSRFQTPIIVQPQVGILGVGAIEKRPIVVSKGHPLEANSGDYLTFAPMTTLGFSYDHRVMDGASADAFCAAIKSTLETWPNS